MMSMSPSQQPLPQEAAVVLTALAANSAPAGARLNDLAKATGLPTGHVGRHLRTLEADRLARFAGGAWQLTSRGSRVAADVPPDGTAAAA